MSDEINDPIAALQSELSRVSVSPDFASRVRERLADELEPLRAELADLAPSPEFAVRVRRSIEQGGQAGLSWSRLHWRWVLPVSGLAAAALMAMMLLTPAERPAPVTAANLIPPSPSAGGPVVAPAPARPSATETIARAKSPSASRAREPRDPMLEVITDQPELLRNLWVRVDPGIVVDSTEPDGNYEAPKIEVAPIEVSPIVTFQVPDLRAPVGVTPFILRIAAESAERSPR